jgi:uncharacterized UPF0160 family protein
MKRIFVHSGLFHGDDVFAVAAAKILWPEAEILRVRELPKDFSNINDIALDIGGEFSFSNNIYDHHFKGGNDDQKAAVGKFWSYFGTFIVEAELGVNVYFKEEIELITDRIYTTLLASIDRADIGISDWAPISEDMQHLSASAFISSMNIDVSDEESQFDNFMVAVNAAKIALIGSICQAQKWVEMKNIIKNGIKHFQGKVLEVSQGGPWQEHILNNSKHDNVLFVMFPSERGGYCIQSVPDKMGSFGTRKSFPKRLCGLRGQELSDAIGGLDSPYESSVFCHPGGFIGGAETIDDTLKLANFAASNN